ncbi:MAG: 30S ribosomal protein S17 [Chloroflexi bacterium]|nr:30S ribosomal protein S17 [Chloroflexota bacterium]
MPRKVLTGEVVSAKMQKTVVVNVVTTKRHPLYNKVLRRNKKYKAHDEDQVCHEGDLVRIEEARPLSRTKRWRVIEIVRRAGE